MTIPLCMYIERLAWPRLVAPRVALPLASYCDAQNCVPYGLEATSVGAAGSLPARALADPDVRRDQWHPKPRPTEIDSGATEHLLFCEP
jgi:hypothetical protein